MSASVRIESGIAAGTRYWIDRPVLRIGSDPQCEICLPTAELAPHAVTLEYRDGNYRAYNRGTAPVSVGADLVKPGANAIWRADQTVQLPGDVRLVLEIDGDPRPSARPETRGDDEYIDDYADETRSAPLAGAGAAVSDDAAAKKRSKSLVQMSIIGICVLFTAAALLMRGGSEKAAANRPTFDEIVRASLSQDEATRVVVRRLQYAQAALVRGNDRLALERFAKLRDQLVGNDDSRPAEDRAEAERILSYVEYRLGQLQ